MAIGNATYVIPSGLTVLVTGLIVARLLLVRRRLIKVMGTSGASSPYMNIVAMLVESYAFESVWSIASAISLGLRSPSFILFSEVDSFIKVIAYFLVVYRVASGRGWTAETESKLTSLQWNRGAQTATDEANGTRSQVPTTIMMAVDSPPIFHSKSAV